MHGKKASLAISVDQRAYKEQRCIRPPRARHLTDRDENGRVESFRDRVEHFHWEPLRAGESALVSCIPRFSFFLFSVLLPCCNRPRCFRLFGRRGTNETTQRPRQEKRWICMAWRPRKASDRPDHGSCVPARLARKARNSLDDDGDDCGLAIYMRRRPCFFKNKQSSGSCEVARCRLCHFTSSDYGIQSLNSQRRGGRGKRKS